MRIIMMGNHKIEKFGIEVEAFFVNVWIIVCSVGSFLGKLYIVVSNDHPKDWIKSWTFSWITGPRIYFNNLLYFLWIFRLILVVLYCIKNKPMLKSSMQIYFCDVSITILFFP